MDKDGKINKENYIDVQRAKKSRFEVGDDTSTAEPFGSVFGGSLGPEFSAIKYNWLQSQQPENVETLETDKVITPE